MNAIAKVLAPAAIVLASFSANAAGLVETDYPFKQPTATQAAASTAMRDAAPSFSGLDIHYPGPSAASDQTPSRADVMQGASESGRRLPLGMSHNA